MRSDGPLQLGPPVTIAVSTVSNLLVIIEVCLIDPASLHGCPASFGPERTSISLNVTIIERMFGQKKFTLAVDIWGETQQVGIIPFPGSEHR